MLKLPPHSLHLHIRHLWAPWRTWLPMPNSSRASSRFLDLHEHRLRGELATKCALGIRLQAAHSAIRYMHIWQSATLFRVRTQNSEDHPITKTTHSEDKGRHRLCCAVTWEETPRGHLREWCSSEGVDMNIILKQITYIPL